MGKQINQYTKTRITSTISKFDLLDVDSTDDNGGAYESAKLRVDELVNYLRSELPTFYGSDGQLTAGLGGHRNITSKGIETKYIGGDVSIEMDNVLDDFAFLIRDNSQAERARLGFDQSKESAVLEMSNSSGVFFLVNDGRVKLTGVLNVIGLPTSTTGLAIGDVWNDSGNLRIIL